MNRLLPIIVATSLVAAALAGCSSSSKTSTPGGGTTSGGRTAATSSATSAGVAAATAFYKTVEETPTSIGVTTPLSKKPATGKTIIALTNGSGSNTELDNGLKAAAALLGWKLKEIHTAGTPEADQAAMATAIQQRPDGISVSGIERSIIGQQLKAAEAAGIPVSANATTDKPGPDLFDASVADVAQLDTDGKMVAAYVVSQSEGKANVAIFDLPVYPILHRFVTSFEANMKTWCPSCPITEVPQQLTDIGTKTPSSVVSTLQRAPKTNWVVFDLGDLATGVDSALKSAGFAGKVQIGGLTATAQNIAAVKSGAENAWTSYPLGMVAFRVMDIFARKFNGDPLTEVQSIQLPNQLITPDNAKTLPVNANGFYTGVSDYAAQFAKLWKVS